MRLETQQHPQHFVRHVGPSSSAMRMSASTSTEQPQSAAPVLQDDTENRESLQQRFDDAAAFIRQWKNGQKSSNDEKLNGYALFKQSGNGDNDTTVPSRLNVKARALWQAWENKRGLSQEESMQQYIDYVKDMREKYGD